jgi:pimeloyl-ACP methyl ester carboxylesterase
MATDPTSCFYSADDGLKLHYLDFAPVWHDTRLPVICLPGLTRSARDFEPLGAFLAGASATPRRVLVFDYRGRGLSEHDPNGKGYTLDIERADLLKALGILRIAHAHFIGTSRGGLHIMAMASGHRDMIRAAVLNDIGPVLEPAGLRRIKGYVGKGGKPKDFAAAIERLKAGAGLHFEGLGPAEWRFFAETTFGSDATDLRPRYDPRLAAALNGLDLEKPLPDSWALFDQLEGIPILTLRGENSDLLSAATLARMESRWRGNEALTVPGQGHAPLLADEPTIARIDVFLAAADRMTT